MSAVATAKTALAHYAQPSVGKRSAGRAWFELRLSMSTPSGSKSRRRPKSADDGPPRHTAETPDSRHALRLILISADASRCRCILRRPTVLKGLLLPSLLPLLMMMTLTTLLLLLHCRCRCRRCCRGFHCRCCCTAVAAASAGCRRSERQTLLQLLSARSAVASWRARRQRAAGTRGDASGTRRGSGSRGPCVRLLPAASKMTRTHGQRCFAHPPGCE